ncbi:MAG: single-stranded DNA-binding protein [Erysipelotrichaceae bacterium]|nr:single-stranded DNA-binding protein [Erysipelotrichaceae bacterium]
MINQCVLVGRIHELPEKKVSSSGTVYASFIMECEKQFRNADGEIPKEYFRIQLWRGLAETCCDTCTKGAIVAIKGRLQANNYESEKGNTVYSCDIVAEKISFLVPRVYQEA